jgi:sec-independent protein translocase protein TatB
MFDIGWSELLTVLVVALVVVGPKDLPRLARMAGRWVGKARAMADQFRKSFDEMAHEAELDDLRAEIDALRRQNPLTEARDELNRSILPPDAKPAPHVDVVEAAEGTAEARDEEPETDKSSVPPGNEPSPS